MRWTERGIPPHVADEIPWRRLLEMDRVYAIREGVQRELSERQEQEADRAQLDQEHVKKMADMGLDPSGKPLQGG